MIPSDSDSNNNSDKLSDERRGSRPSQESSPSTSPNLSDTSPLLKPNKSRGEKTQSLHSVTTYTLPALDLAQCTTSSLTFKKQNIESTINPLDLTDEIIDDIYNSISSWDETEIDSKDKHTMNIDKFIAFFDKYIYSTLCVDDDEYDLQHNKQIIAQAMFDYICFRNSDEIQFAHLFNAVNKLTKTQFVKALNVYTVRTVHRKLSDPSSSPLESINEHTPLLDDDEFAIEEQIYNSPISQKETQTLLMEDAKALFERFDSRKCGKLNISQFQSLLLELYPDMNDEDFSDIFSKIDDDCDASLDFEYKEKINNFAAEIKMLNAFPEKNTFLQILMCVFGEIEVTECKTYDDLNRSCVNKIVLASNIRDQFSKNVNKTGYEIESCGQDLWRWIEENGIPAIKQNKIYQDIIEKYSHSSDEYNEMKERNNACNNTNVKIFTELNELKEILNELTMGNDKQLKGIQSLLQNDINMEMIASMKQKLLDKEVKINKLEYELKQYEDHKEVLKYIQNNVTDRNNLGFVKRVLVIVYAVGAMVIAMISFLGFKSKNKYWTRMLTVSTGFFIGFAVALSK